MKLLLVTFLALNLAVDGWAVPIEDPVVEETALSLKQLLDVDAAIEDISIRNVCNETYTTASGMISTPGFPGDYTNNMNCYWLIITGTGTKIQLSFDTFVLETSNDVLRVYDGPSLSSPLIGLYTGYTTPPNLISSGNTLYLNFTTDVSVTYAGFRTRYSSFIDTDTTTTTTTTTTNPTTTLPPNITCGGTFVGSGFVYTPNYPSPYDPNSNCVWYLQSNSQFITLNLTQFVTENKADYAEIWDGWDLNIPPLAKLTGNLSSDLPIAFTSTTGNRMSVRFISDESVEESGFLAFFSSPTTTTIATTTTADTTSTTTTTTAITTAATPTIASRPPLPTS